MTDRLKGVLVTFQHDIRVDDAEAVISAIKMVKGVIAVDPVPSNIETHMAETRVRLELGGKIWNVLYPDMKKE